MNIDIEAASRKTRFEKSARPSIAKVAPKDDRSLPHSTSVATSPAKTPACDIHMTDVVSGRSSANTA